MSYVIPQDDDGLQSFATAGSYSTTTSANENELAPKVPIGNTKATPQKRSKHAPASLSYAIVETDAGADPEIINNKGTIEVDTSANADAVAFAGFADVSVDDEFGDFAWPTARAVTDLSIEENEFGDDTNYITKKTSKSSSTTTVRKEIIETKPGQQPVKRWIEAVANAETEGSLCVGSGEGEDVEKCKQEGAKTNSKASTVAHSGEETVFLDFDK